MCLMIFLQATLNSPPPYGAVRAMQLLIIQKWAKVQRKIDSVILFF